MTPLSVAFAWLFFRVFERPFMTTDAVKVPARSTTVVNEDIGLAREVA
jgi:hypothetical protein